MEGCDAICHLCPRDCGGVRGRQVGGGFCAMPRLPVLAKATLHHWEEPCLSGTGGTGAVFFSGCTLDCVYCQNEAISHGRLGKIVSIARLREIFEELIHAGAHNIDLVNPTHFSAAILESLQSPLSVPVVWNSSGYEKVESLQALEGKVQIYLPDMKYPDEAAGCMYSGVKQYPMVAQRAVEEMLRQTGPYVMGADGLLKKGVLIRHLILPGRVAQAKAVMDWVAGFPKGSILFSLMGQYVPVSRAKTMTPLDRTLRASELRVAVEYMGNLDLDGFIQDKTSAKTEYIPKFDLLGL